MPTTDPFDIAGRVAIVTGGSRGLGRAIATGFAARGATVVVTSRNLDSCEDAVKEIEAAGGTASAIAANVGDLDDVSRVVTETVERHGGIDILVNNAADPSLYSAEEIDEENYDRVFAVNAKGPFFLAQRAMPHLQASGRGSIINVISVGVWNGGAMMLLYRSTKSAMLGATMALAKEWAPKGIRVNAIAPGPFETDMVDWMNDTNRANTIAATPQQRFADPSEMLPTALYLASDASSFTTGAVLRVDGGMLSF